MNRAAAALQQLRSYGRNSVERIRGRLQRVSHCWRLCLVHVLGWSIMTFATFMSILVSYLLLYYYYIPAERIARTVYFHYEEDQPSFRLDVAGLHPAVAYDVSLQLLVPDIAGLSESLGNVMLHTQISPAALLMPALQSSRATLLVYRSWPTRLALLTLRLMPVVLGVAREATTHRIFLFEDVQLGATEATVEVQMGGRIPVYEATLEMVAHFVGLRYLMYYWRWAFGALVVGVLTLGAALMISILVAASLYYRLSLVHSAKEAASDASQTYSDDLNEAPRSSSSMSLLSSTRSATRRRRTIVADLAVPDTVGVFDSDSSGAESGPSVKPHDL